MGDQTMTDEPVLTVEDLHVSFRTRDGVVRAVDGLGYELHAGETLAIVGESGSGKSVSTMALMGLVPQPPGEVTGSVSFGGRDLLSLGREDLRRIRGNDLAMIFQDPMSSLNPVLSIGRQLTEGMQEHLRYDTDRARDRAVELLELVGLSDPRRRLDQYPHELSGGQRQRVMIAIGLACEPQVLIADEPTTALDVTIQAQIAQLIGDLQDQLGMAVIWISHDLGVVAGIADRVMVMYAGRMLELADVDELYADPRHPYTQGLLDSLPRLGAPSRELAAIPGRPPDLTDPPPGCAFWPRCPHRLDERCEDQRPPWREISPTHRVATFYDPPERGA